MIYNFMYKTTRGIANVRYNSTIPITLDNEIFTKLERGELKPRKHPGTQRCSEIILPKPFQSAILKSIKDFPLKNLISDGEKLSRYIKLRHAPPEQNFVDQKTKEIEQELNKIFPAPENIKQLSPLEVLEYQNNRKVKFQSLCKQRIFSWKPINYGKYQSMVYAVGRSSMEYTVLTKVLNEIRTQDTNFKPKSFFDFGSGVGTGMWAVSNLYKDTIYEFYNVDSSKDMNELANLILRAGNDNQQSNLQNVYFRQFLPAKNAEYDLIISSFSLMDLSSKKNRLETLLNLWKKCAQYLVIIEEGTRQGFELVAEARNFLLSQSENDSDLQGYVFSPCSHEHNCPRITNEKDRTPCNFEVQYEPLSFFGKQSKKLNHLYSYIVLKKGSKSNSCDYMIWPRIIRPTLVRKRHTVCRLCTANGNLQEIIFTASKHGKLTYQCARSSKWGDKLPVRIEKLEKDENS